MCNCMWTWYAVWTEHHHEGCCLHKRTCERYGNDEVDDNNKEICWFNKWDGKIINDVDGNCDTEMYSTEVNDNTSKGKN